MLNLHRENYEIHSYLHFLNFICHCPSEEKIIHLFMHCQVQWDIFGTNMLVFHKLEKMEENITVLENAGTLACFQFKTNLIEKQTIHVNQYSYLLYK